MCETESGGNFGVDYPLALGCGQAAKSVSSFQMKFCVPFPIILSFGVRRESRSVAGHRFEE
jgi:hypothetical protein